MCWLQFHLSEKVDGVSATGLFEKWYIMTAVAWIAAAEVPGSKNREGLNVRTVYAALSTTATSLLP
jgi:hypothetical protein